MGRGLPVSENARPPAHQVADAVARAVAGFTHLAFGDLLLDDVRCYSSQP